MDSKLPDVVLKACQAVNLYQRCLVGVLLWHGQYSVELGLHTRELWTVGILSGLRARTLGQWSWDGAAALPQGHVCLRCFTSKWLLWVTYLLFWHCTKTTREEPFSLLLSGLVNHVFRAEKTNWLEAEAQENENLLSDLHGNLSRCYCLPF